MGGARNIFRRAALVLLAAVIGLVAYTASATGLVRNQLPMPFGVGLATVKTGSMSPAITPGDLLVVNQLTEDQTPAVGDVVVYQDPALGLVVHRVVALDGELVTTRGDANNAADVPFDCSLVIGRVVAVVPLLGYVANALKTPAGLFACLAAALLLTELPLRHQQQTDEQERERLRAQIAELKAQRGNDGGDDND